MMREMLTHYINRYAAYGLQFEGSMKVQKRDKTGFSIISQQLPILRPMSDLYAEIIESGYNDGQPFIPLGKLAQERYPHLASRRFFADAKYIECAEDDLSGWSKIYEIELEEMSVGEFDLLHRLKFDYRGLIDAKLAVSVHDLPTNPYEA